MGVLNRFLTIITLFGYCQHIKQYMNINIIPTTTIQIFVATLINKLATPPSILFNIICLLIHPSIYLALLLALSTIIIITRQIQQISINIYPHCQLQFNQLIQLLSRLQLINQAYSKVYKRSTFVTNHSSLNIQTKIDQLKSIYQSFLQQLEHLLSHTIHSHPSIYVPFNIPSTQPTTLQTIIRKYQSIIHSENFIFHFPNTTLLTKFTINRIRKYNQLLINQIYQQSSKSLSTIQHSITHFNHQENYLYQNLISNQLSKDQINHLIQYIQKQPIKQQNNITPQSHHSKQINILENTNTYSKSKINTQKSKQTILYQWDAETNTQKISIKPVEIHNNFKNELNNILIKKLINKKYQQQNSLQKQCQNFN